VGALRTASDQSDFPEHGGDGGCISFLELHNKLPETWWLKTQKCILSQFWRLEVQKQGVGRAMYL